MTSPDVQPALEVIRAEPDRFLATDDLVWFSEPETEPVELAVQGVPADQRFAVDIDGPASAPAPASYAGIYGVRPLQMSITGGGDATRLVPIAGLTWVGVHPDHRRRGVLRAMMTHHLAQTRREGVAVSGLHCSEPEIYGRYGYGLAMTETRVTLGRGTTFTAPGLEEEAARIRTRTLTYTDPGVAALMEEGDRVVAATEPGTLVFLPEVYEQFARVRPADLRDKEPPRLLIARLDGVPVGMASFRRSHKWERGRPGGEVEVRYLGGTPAARLVLLRRLVQLDLMASVTIPSIGLDDPLWHWLPGPRAMGDAWPSDNLWVRVVDLPAAFAARGYDGAGDVVVAVTDDLLPENAGTWRIRVADGEAAVTRSDAAPEVTLDIAALGAAWPGAATLVPMRRAGLIAEHRPGAVGELSRALRADAGPTPSPGF